MYTKITKEEIVTLKNYKYQSTPPTPLDKFLNPFWIYCTELLPMWMAPNLVTFIGFIFAVLGNVVMVTASNDMGATIPSWALLLNAICVFVYQTFDSMDGKQARRTKSSSILGQLFDHGCDSFLIPFYAVNLMQVLKKGSDVWSLVWVIALLYYYFVMTWEEYNIEILPTGSGLFGSTECTLLNSNLCGNSGVTHWSNIWPRIHNCAIHKCRMGKDYSLFNGGYFHFGLSDDSLYIYHAGDSAY